MRLLKSVFAIVICSLLVFNAFSFISCAEKPDMPVTEAPEETIPEIPDTDTYITPETIPETNNTTAESDNITPELPKIKREITLADSPQVLDLSSFLPDSFEHVDADSIGYSTQQQEMDFDFSETEVFVKEYTFQLISCSYTIVGSVIQRASYDEQFKDEQLVKSLLLDEITNSDVGTEFNIEDINIDISYPQIGDMAILGECTYHIESHPFGSDLLVVKVGKVYLIIETLYHQWRQVKLPSIAEEIINRINEFEH